MNPLLKPKLRRIRTLLLLVGGIVVVGVVVGVVGGMLWLKYTMPLIFGPFQSLQMAAAQFAVRDVAADLGGMPVTIPRHFANYVEYNGDPGWGEKRKGPRPERTQASKLSSFGFYARFPDMAGLSSPDLRKDKESQSIYNTMWIDVTLTTGAFYPGDGFLMREPVRRKKNGDQFKELAVPEDFSPRGTRAEATARGEFDPHFTLSSVARPIPGFATVLILRTITKQCHVNLIT